ncbi:MAG: hypothetical protein AVDCRST_MAG22-996 [uncultured Rubrobacteraceae bacterium]|uniref:Uncharacterized protein n=1 Tax=uncultured Rubrobacteraceae bacterium TaxID=349277 RepID=A0A6J4NUB5_9ACTN|nr:MAG: hypothetical protein AVDCRST_MAG22-996 [uncultured Rubrobacteraceae bacterium]
MCWGSSLAPAAISQTKQGLVLIPRWNASMSG